MVRSLVVLSILLLGPSPGLIADEGAAAEWKQTRLDLAVTLDPAAGTSTIEGTLGVLLAKGSADSIELEVNSRKPIVAFDSVSVQGRESTASFRSEERTAIARLTFSEPVVEGRSLEIQFHCTSTGRSFQFVVDPEGAVASWVEGWSPRVRDADPATIGTTRITMPAAWKSISNGARTGRSVEGDQATESWTLERPRARSFVAAPFASVENVTQDGLTVNLALLTPDPSVTSQAATLARAIGVMEKRFGPYPYSHYAIVEIPEKLVSYAASSEQGFITVRSSALHGAEGNLPLFAHEAAHGWWGNLVQQKGDGGKMVSEAMAQFGALISIEALEGEDAAARFLRYSREGYSPLQCALGYFHIWRLGGDKPLSRLANDKWDHDLSDSKGHWFYWMLRHRLGDETFFGVLRDLLRRYEGREMSLSDLRAAFLASAPSDAGLDAFMTQWLDRTAAPVLDVDWWSINRGKGIEIHAQQLQPGDPFVVPLEVVVDLEGGGVLERTLDLANLQDAFTFETPARPLGVRLDPRTRLLLWRPEYGSRPPGASRAVSRGTDAPAKNGAP